MSTIDFQWITYSGNRQFARLYDMCLVTVTTIKKRWRWFGEEISIVDKYRGANIIWRSVETGRLCDAETLLMLDGLYQKAVWDKEKCADR
jgi:hypothetical protein